METDSRLNTLVRAWCSLIDRMIPGCLPSAHAHLPSGFGGMDNILKWLERHSQYDVYSFDVFDTLLRRRIDPPELIKALAAEYLSTRLAQHGIAVSPAKISAQRSRCEELLLGEALSRGRDADYSLDDVVAGTLKAIKAEGVLSSEQVVSYEMGLEKKAAQPMPGAVEVLSYVKSIGKRVICMSDTYLSASQMAAILEHQNLMKYIDKLYVSSEIGKRKSTGRLFRHVLETEGSKLVHIGDNYTSDYIIPKKLGIKALRLNSRSEGRMKGKLRKLRDGKNKMDYVNAIVRSDAGEGSELHRIGYEVLGPALTVFVHNVAEQARKDKVEAIFFIARDGYALKKIYEILQSGVYENASLPPGKYMCLSRFAVRSASVHRFLESDDFQRTVQEKSNEARKLLRDYLVSIGFMGKRNVAVVDATVEGITQSLLAQAFANDEGFPIMHGYYFNVLNLNRHSTGDGVDLSQVRGIVSDWRRCSVNEQEPFARFAIPIELFSHPNHGVTIGYKRVDDKVVPVFRKTPQESQYSLTSQVLKGILAYAKDYSLHYDLHNYRCDELLEHMRNNVRQWSLFPPKSDVKELKGLFMTSDWPQEVNNSLVKKITIRDILTIREFVKKVRTSLWPQATLTLAPLPGLNWLFYRAKAFRR